MRRPPLAARRVLVVAPHPDDETIGAWGLIRQMRAAGASVRVVVVTDGGASHPGSRTWPPQRLMRERRRETTRVLAKLGVAKGALHFCGLPDGGLSGAKQSLRRVLGRMVRQGRPALIVGPVGSDAHADHRAVAEALAALPGRGARRLGYRVWPEQHRPEGEIRVPIGAAALRRKLHAVRSYRTQMGLIRDAEAGFAMTPRHLRAFVRPFERFEVLA